MALARHLSAHFFEPLGRFRGVSLRSMTWLSPDRNTSLDIVDKDLYMKEIDWKCLEYSDYPHVFQQITHFGEMDIVGHINNISIARYYENARAYFLESIYGRDFFRPGQIDRPVLVDVRVRYFKEIYFPETVETCSAITHIGKSSFAVAQGIFRDGILLGTCDSVAVNVLGGRSRVIAAERREHMARFQVGAPSR